MKPRQMTLGAYDVIFRDILLCSYIARSRAKINNWQRDDDFTGVWPRGARWTTRL